MRTEHPLTLTVEEAGRALGVGRSTAYELVRTGDLECIRLRRRIVVPAAHLAERLGVTAAELHASLQPASEEAATAPRRRSSLAETLDAPRLF